MKTRGYTAATRYESTANTTTVYTTIPQGPPVEGRVKLVENVESWPEQAHPGKRHRWRHLLHYGELGTGFAQCFCGAIGIPYKFPKDWPRTFGPP